MDIKKPTYRDRPTDKALSFSWSWRPKSLEQLDEAIRLTARIRDVRVLRGFILGLAIKVFWEDPQQWIFLFAQQKLVPLGDAVALLAGAQHVRINDLRRRSVGSR